jgi:hypothetical protein
MRRLALILLCALMPAAGCNHGPPPQVVVRGTVHVNGQPLRGGTVVFTPDPKRGGRGPVSFAIVDQDGGFVLGSENGAGAVRGWHRITVAPPPDATDLIEGLQRYSHPDLSGLDFEVREGQDNVVPLKLEWNQ